VSSLADRRAKAPNTKTAGPKTRRIVDEMALAALLSRVIPLHFRLLAVSLGRWRISGKRGGGKGNRKTQRNNHRNDILHGVSPLRTHNTSKTPTFVFGFKRPNGRRN
jgi:hypothetical protein